MLNGALLMWFFLTLLSLIYLTFALIYRTPGPFVMKTAWFLVVLYTGPIGLFIYLLSCQEPMPGMHEKYIEYRWKQAIGSEVHCLAGDATGIIIAAIALSFFAVSPMMEMIIEYIAGFACGLLIFQALFMKDMMGGSYWKAIKGTFFPEWLSMNMIMAGMILIMYVWRYYDPSASSPATLSFWGSMSLATLVGGIIAYPINDWLVVNGLKHGMVTVRKPHHAEAQIMVTEGGKLSPQHAMPAEHKSQHKHAMGIAKVSKMKLALMTILTLVVLALGVAIGLIWTH